MLILSLILFSQTSLLKYINSIYIISILFILGSETNYMILIVFLVSMPPRIEENSKSEEFNLMINYRSLYEKAILLNLGPFLYAPLEFLLFIN